jgi:hypothetical protein
MDAMTNASSKLDVDARLDGDVWRVTVTGLVDEDAELARLDSLTGKVEINLKGVRRFNSVGTRDWVQAMQRLSKKATVVLVECSPAVIGQLNMISGFLGHGTVRSFYGPMRCSVCGHEANHLFATRECRDAEALPPVTCPKCRSQMDLDELEDSYLLFLREPTVIRED